MDAIYPDEVTRAWIAGFFDGEGTVGVTHRGVRRGKPSDSLQCRISIVNTDLEVLQFLEDTYGGGISRMAKPLGYQQCYSWTISGPRSEVFVRDILPYSRTKRPQLELYLTARSLLAKPHELSKPFGAEKSRMRAEVSLAVAAFKHPGRED